MARVSTAWSPAPANLDLSRGEVHIWRASLVPETNVLPRLEATLALDEKSRAARFIFQPDRTKFIAARGILRELLGSYVGRPPAALKFQCGPQGKPALNKEDSHLPVRFSLSHSHDLALYAFALDRELGIDLELIRPDFGGQDVGERFFSARELAELCGLPPEFQPEGFFACWTRKEAYVEARGGGLQIPLDSFDVSVTPGCPEQLRSADCSRWSLRSFEPGPGFVAAVVVEGSDWRVRHFEWAPQRNLI